jgi:hypothetical protein
MVTTDEMVDAIVNVNAGVTSSAYRDSFRNALRELVKLAKAEQLLQMKQDVAKAVGIEHRYYKP